MRFSLQDMVRQTLAAAEEREKLAAAVRPESKQGQRPPAHQEEDEGEVKEAEVNKTSAVFVEKLASAVEYLNVEYLPKLAAGTIGAGTGPNTLPTNLSSPTPGRQNYETGQAHHDQPPMTPGKDPKSPGQVNPATALETTINSPPGGSEEWTNKNVMKQAQIARVAAIMAKMAGEDTAKAHILAAHHDSPPPATKAEEGVPGLPGPAAAQERLIDSNQAAINYTKQQAKAEPKRRMGEVLDEPAQKKSSDPVLHNNLDAASGAGVKISSAEKMAAARALLQKIAEEGAKDDASPEAKEKAGKLQQLMKKHKHEEGESKSEEHEEHEKEGQLDGALGGGF